MFHRAKVLKPHINRASTCRRSARRASSLAASGSYHVVSHALGRAITAYLKEFHLRYSSRLEVSFSPASAMAQARCSAAFECSSRQ